MKNSIPEFLTKKLIEQYGQENYEKILEGYSIQRQTTLRANLIKKSREEIEKELINNGFKPQKVNWYKNAFILKDIDESQIRQLEIYKNGEIYLQSLSSMMPVMVLQPKPEENILDMTAAPGGKTTQIASETENKAFITATEKNKIRSERLKYNIEKQGATRITVLNQDARELDNFFSFDKILLDAPCSGNGTINLNAQNLEKTFTEELVKRSVKTQFELLKKAVTVLKKGHEMIYSTCSILKEENEENIQKILKLGNVELIPIDKEMFKEIPLLPVNIEGTICVCPSELYEGFFIAKLKKK